MARLLREKRLDGAKMMDGTLLERIALTLTGPSGSLDLDLCNCNTHTPSRLMAHYPRCPYRLLAEAALALEHAG